MIKKASGLMGHKALLAYTLLLVAPASAAHAQQPKGFDALDLKWHIVRDASVPVPAGQSRAVLVLTNTGGRPFPGGWSIYFNSLSRAADAPGGAEVDQLVGTLYRIRPVGASGALAPGQSIRLFFNQLEAVVPADKGPRGPYIVMDKDPGAGHVLTRYQSIITPADQLAADAVTPSDLYEKYSNTRDIAVEDLPAILPTPLHTIAKSGELRLGSIPAIIAPASLSQERRFAESLFTAKGLTSTSANPAKVYLAIGKIPGQASPEAYQLEVGAPASIRITGNSAAGVYYGLQSLRQLISKSWLAGRGVALPCLKITDAPGFRYRGMMVDVARNFQNKASILRALDLMARFKLNKFHFHLTDDEGWRLQIKRLPELTTFGASRGHSATLQDPLPPAYGSGPLDDYAGTGFFTQADYLDILAYAKARHIEVIPEIEMPGHARAAVQAMKWRSQRLRRAGQPNPDQYLLADPSDQSKYKSVQSYNDNVMDPGLDSTYAFIDVVIGELAALHRRAGVPLRTVIVGADEPPAGAWEGSPAARNFFKNNAKFSTEALWEHFYDRVIAIAQSHGAKIGAWEELGMRTEQTGSTSSIVANPHFLKKGVTLHVWNNLGANSDLANKLANAGYKIIEQPATNLYFDMAYLKDLTELGTNWAAYTDLDDVYAFNPYTFGNGPGRAELTQKGRSNIEGLSGAIWTELMRNPVRLQYMLMPRLIGLAERGWNPLPAHGTSWSVFTNQVGKLVLPTLDAEAPDVGYRIPPPGVKLDRGRVLVNEQLPGMILRYTVDGTAPTSMSSIVAGPIATKGLITVAAFNRNGRAGRISQIVNP